MTDPLVSDETLQHIAECEGAPFITVRSEPTLRDQFAMAALTGILARRPTSREDAAEEAYAYADAMMEARK